MGINADMVACDSQGCRFASRIWNEKTMTTPVCFEPINRPALMHGASFFPVGLEINHCSYFELFAVGISGGCRVKKFPAFI
jgi:hypothetical protein